MAFPEVVSSDWRFVFCNRKTLFKRNKDIYFGATLAALAKVSPIRHFERGVFPGDEVGERPSANSYIKLENKQNTLLELLLLKN